MKNSKMVIAGMLMVSVLGGMAPMSASVAQAQQSGVHGRSDLATISAQIINVVEEIRSFVNLTEYQMHFMPLKRTAARARAVANARGDTSARTLAVVNTLLTKIDEATEAMDDLLERDAAFGYTTQLMTLQEQLRDLLD